VSNFRPTIARFLYSKYAKNGVVLDPCMGYGGRLLGASAEVSEYHGFDPSSQSIDGNNKLCSFLKSKSNFEFKPTMKPFEDSDLKDNFYDFIFTSPPYFDIEKYSHEDTQSWIRYKNGLGLTNF
jgi:DNA modification methylase